MTVIQEMIHKYQADLVAIRRVADLEERGYLSNRCGWKSSTKLHLAVTESALAGLMDLAAKMAAQTLH